MIQLTNDSTAKSTLEGVIALIPDAEKPGRSSKHAGPPREDAEKIARDVLAGGRERILELIGLIRDAAGGGSENYKPGYALHCVALWASAGSERESERRLLCEAIASRLGGAKPSKDVQAFLVRELQVAGGPEAIGPLAKLLGDDALCEYAAQALVAIGGGAAARALREALPASAGSPRATTIAQALGVLRDGPSIERLLELTRDSSADTRLAAITALAKIGSPVARGALVASADRAKGWERIQATKACLVLAERLAESGGAAEARRIYAHLRKTRTDQSERYIREAAKRGLATL